LKKLASREMLPQSNVGSPMNECGRDNASQGAKGDSWISQATRQKWSTYASFNTP